MSVTASLSPSTGTTSGGTRGRRRMVLIGLGLLVVLVVLSVLRRDDAAVDGPLDPRNPGPDGAQALARVLEEQGTEVDVARGQRALLGARIDPGTVVVGTGVDALGASTVGRLEEHAAPAAALVYAGPADVLATLDADVLAGVDAAPLAPDLRAAGCPDPLVGELSVRTRGGVGLVGPPGATACFATADGEGAAGLLRSGDTWVLATPGSLANQHVAEADAAALGVRLLGQGDRVVWYVPDAADTEVSDGVRLGDLLPPWLVPALWLLGAAVLALLLVAGRRLGPLVSEPLPVGVRAAESTYARGRLYHRTGDRDHAARVLVAATHARLAARLRLPTDATRSEVAAAVATRTRRDPREVEARLAPPPPARDSQLVELGRRLQDLEDEVQRA